jgi:hypothetical protein
MVRYLSCILKSSSNELGLTVTDISLTFINLSKLVSKIKIVLILPFNCIKYVTKLFIANKFCLFHIFLFSKLKRISGYSNSFIVVFLLTWINIWLPLNSRMLNYEILEQYWIWNMRFNWEITLLTGSVSWITHFDNILNKLNF